MTDHRGLLSVEQLARFIDDTVSEYPREVEWFDDDADFDRWVQGDKTVKPKLSIYTRLRIPERIFENYPKQLFDECQRIADKYGCEFRPDGSDWVISKPLGGKLE
jgi:hypothetical protein